MRTRYLVFAALMGLSFQASAQEAWRPIQNNSPRWNPIPSTVVPAQPVPQYQYQAPQPTYPNRQGNQSYTRFNRDTGVAQTCIVTPSGYTTCN